MPFTPKLGKEVNPEQISDIENRYTPTLGREITGTPEAETEVIQPEKPSTFLDKLAGFVGVKNIGEIIARGLFKLTPESKMLKEADIKEEDVLGKAPTAGQILGDVGQLALTATGLKGAGTAGKLLTRGVKSAGLGAGFGVTGALQEGKTDIAGLAKSGALGAGLGAGLTGVGALAGAAGRRLTINTPRQLVNFALRVPAKKIGQETNEAFLKRGLGGKSLAQIEEVTQKEAKQVGKRINKRLAQTKGRLDINEFSSRLSKDINQRQATNLTTSTLKDRIKSFVPDNAKLVDKKSLNWQQANKLRQAIDNNLKETTFLGKELTNEQKAVKRFADGLRRLIQEKTPTKKLFKQQSEAIRITTLAKEALKKIESSGRPGLLDVAGGGLGFGLGGLPGAIGAVTAQRALRSPRVLGGLAQGLRGAGKLSPLFQKLSPAERTAILKLFSQTQ